MQIDRDTSSDRESSLQSKQNKTPLDWIPLVVIYHPGLPPLKSILEIHLPISHVSNRLSMAMRNPPLVAYRRPPNAESPLYLSQLENLYHRIEETPGVTSHVVKHVNILIQ